MSRGTGPATRRPLIGLVVLLLVALPVGLVVAGSGGGSSSGEDERSGPAAPARVQKGPIGVLTEVTGDHLTVRPDGGGPEIEYVVAAADLQAVDPNHLLQHQARRWPVRVLYQRSGGTRFAKGSEDAGAPRNPQGGP